MFTAYLLKQFSKLDIYAYSKSQKISAVNILLLNI
jgi:hypothetical protein